MMLNKKVKKESGAASQGLAAWFHNCNKPGLKAKLNLRADQRVLFGQTVGYPVKK